MSREELQKQIELIFNCSSYESGIAMVMIETYAMHEYNKALKDAAEKCNYPYKDEYGCGCNVPSIILSLKK